MFYDVPPEVPLLRFLDTRGLGEPDYDPANDIAWCEGQSHLLLIVMQVADPAQHTVLRVLREARHRHPDWPVIPMASIVEAMAVKRAPVGSFAALSVGGQAFTQLWRAIERRLVR